MKITDSKKYKKDLLKFTQKVEKIIDKKQKNYYQKILYEFQHKAKIIDDSHSSINSAKINPRIIRENLQELGEIRYQLENIKY